MKRRSPANMSRWYDQFAAALTQLEEQKNNPQLDDPEQQRNYFIENYVDIIKSLPESDLSRIKEKFHDPISIMDHAKRQKVYEYISAEKVRLFQSCKEVVKIIPVDFRLAICKSLYELSEQSKDSIKQLKAEEIDIQNHIRDLDKAVQQVRSSPFSKALELENLNTILNCANAHLDNIKKELKRHSELTCELGKIFGNRDSEDKPICKICFTDPITQVLPCGHPYCMACMHSLCTLSDPWMARCASCRKTCRTTEALRIYF